MNSAGEVKLSDFGVIGKVESTLGNATTFTGSSAYMSPERLKDMAHKMNSDCWSLGMIVLESALGYYPFADAPAADGGKQPQLSVFQLMQKISTADPGVSLERVHYSDPFRDFCRRCLIRDPDLRPSSSELAQHPWIARSRAEKTDMKKWVQSVAPKRV